MFNRYGNPITNKFFKNSLCSVDRNNSSGKWAKKSWIKRLFGVQSLTI